MPTWPQRYDPLHSAALSTLVAALPIVVLLGALASRRVKAHAAALLGLATALVVATLVVGMPVPLALAAAADGAAYGLFPIGWIVLNVIFLYRLTLEAGRFETLRASLGGLTRDRRLQLVLVAFCLGAFFEGAAGFGTPVAVSAALLIGLGFPPLEASAFSLIANTAPVAFGALGTPVVALAGVTGLDVRDLSAMVGRQLAPFALIVPFWLTWAYAGWRGLRDLWPALLVTAVFFALPQLLISNLHGPWLAAVVASVVSLAALALFLRVWHPRTEPEVADAALLTHAPPPRGDVARAWLPWAILSVVVFAWGLPQVKRVLDGISAPKLHVPFLDDAVLRLPPVVPHATAEPAIFALNWLSATGSGILVAAIAAGFVMGIGPARMLRVYATTLRSVATSLLTISAMMALGFTTRYSGADGILGLAFARTGVLYPFFGAMLGWLGVAMTGSDTSSNVLFGSLQTISAGQLHLSPTLMASANSSGGVMGKMIDAQSIVVASTATQWHGHESSILRYVFRHSLALAVLVGIWILIQAYVLTGLIVR